MAKPNEPKNTHQTHSNTVLKSVEKNSKEKYNIMPVTEKQKQRIIDSMPKGFMDLLGDIARLVMFIFWTISKEKLRLKVSSIMLLYNIIFSLYIIICYYIIISNKTAFL